MLDGSFGTSGALPGPNFIITAGMGRQVGTNLFHSFSDFNLTSGQSATFTDSGSAGPISNILARVTGGTASSIDGTINSQIAGANLFLLNPAGLMFGPNAVVNVSGSFVVGSPDYVKLADGGKFNTSLGDDSQLTSAAVSAFGFLSPTPQPVSFAGTQLSMPTGTGLHVIAGDITLDQGVPDGGTEQGTNLAAPSGNITLFSAASAGEVPFSLASPGTGFASATNASFGNITIQNQSSVAIDGAGGGSVVIRGGQLTVDNSTVTSLDLGGQPGGNVSLQADDLTVSDGSFIGTESDFGATAAAGSLTAIVSGNITVSTGAEISADTETSANGGTISLKAGGNISLRDDGTIVAGTDGAGNAGAISLQAASLDIGAGQSEISALSNGSGKAGTIDVNVSGAVNMTDDSAIAANTYGGPGGNITIQALQLNMTGTSMITANTTLAGTGGNITVDAGSVSIQGTGSLVLSLNVFLIGLTGIAAESIYSSGNAGSITVNTDNLSLSSGAAISTVSIGPGKGGPIFINCTNGELSNDSEVTSASFTDAGAVQINANAFTLSGNSSVTASAAVDGGDITLRAGSMLSLFDSNIQSYAGFDNNVNQAGGIGGNILIDPTFVVLYDSFISANDLAPGGKDGNIINQADFFFTEDSTLHATGTIETTPPDLDLAASLVGLPANLVDVNQNLRERCAQAVNHEYSTFIVVGRGGTEAAPEELQPDSGMPNP